MKDCPFCLKHLRTLLSNKSSLICINCKYKTRIDISANNIIYWSVNFDVEYFISSYKRENRTYIETNQSFDPPLIELDKFIEFPKSIDELNEIFNNLMKLSLYQ